AALRSESPIGNSGGRSRCARRSRRHSRQRTRVGTVVIHARYREVSRRANGSIDRTRRSTAISIAKYMSCTQPSFASLEGFVDALAVADGLRKAGADLTREKFVDGLESLHDVDIGLGNDAS